MTTFKFLSAILIMALAWSAPAAYSVAAPQYSQAFPAFSDDELDQMLAPIALYPDPLLAQILPASSFGYQISQAQQLLGGQVNENLIESQNWDVSVKAVAHYPDILAMMAEHPDWTASLGQAFITQEAAVAHSIQRLRIVALNDNVLKTTPQQHVIVQHNVVKIVPARANVIYVPIYDPYSIWGFPPLFASSVVPGGVISFGPGFLIGSWLNRDWDWHGRGPFYHGWRGGGWVGASRPHVNTGNRIYVNNHFHNITVNRAVEQKNTRDFRSRMEQNAVAREKPGARPPEAKAPPAPAPAPAPPPEAKAPPAPSAPAEREKPTQPQERPAPSPAPKAPPAAAPEAKPTPPSAPNAPARPGAPGPQARPSRPPAPKAPPAAAPEAKPTPPSAPNAPARPAAPGPQARPTPPPAPKAPPAAAPAPQAKPTPPPAPNAPARPGAPGPQARPTPPPAPKAPPAAAPAPQAKPTPPPAPPAAPRPAAPGPQARPTPPPAPKAPPAAAPAPQAKPTPPPAPQAAPAPSANPQGGAPEKPKGGGH